MQDDTYLTTTKTHSQSFTSILTNTTNDMGAVCGAFEIRWYQVTLTDTTPVLADSNVFYPDPILKELNVSTDNPAKVNVYTVMYEVYLLDYPSVKSSMKTAFVQTIEDSCTMAKGLTITGTSQQNPPAYEFDGNILSVLNIFV
jgi:hypothetical protein